MNDCVFLFDSSSHPLRHLSNLYPAPKQDMSGTAGGPISLGGSGGGVRADGGRGSVPSSMSVAAAAAMAGGSGGMDRQGTLWPAFAMHQPGDSVTFLPRRGDDGYAAPRGHSATVMPGGAGGCYRSLQAFMSGGSMGSGAGGLGGLVGAGSLGVVGGALASEALPLGYPDPLLLEHATSALELAAGVLRGARMAGGQEDVVCRCTNSR